MRIKRTYNLDEATVLTVRELVERRNVASSQDAFVEQALSDLILSVRHADEAQQFAAASRDPEVRRELDDIDDELDPLDPGWPE